MNWRQEVANNGHTEEELREIAKEILKEALSSRRGGSSGWGRSASFIASQMPGVSPHQIGNWFHMDPEIRKVGRRSWAPVEEE